MYEITALYALNLHNVVCQLCLNKSGKIEMVLEIIGGTYMLNYLHLRKQLKHSVLLKYKTQWILLYSQDCVSINSI